MLENIEATYNQFQLKGSNYHLRGYVMNEDAADSYDVVFAAWNLNRAAKSDGAWFADYVGAYLGGVFHDIYGSFDYAWYISIALSIFAGLIHLPIIEKQVVRLQTT